jgi:hypothetical protein
MLASLVGRASAGIEVPVLITMVLMSSKNCIWFKWLLQRQSHHSKHGQVHGRRSSYLFLTWSLDHHCPSSLSCITSEGLLVLNQKFSFHCSITAEIRNAMQAFTVRAQESFASTYWPRRFPAAIDAYYISDSSHNQASVDIF